MRPQEGSRQLTLVIGTLAVPLGKLSATDRREATDDQQKRLTINWIHGLCRFVTSATMVSGLRSLLFEPVLSPCVPPPMDWGP